MNVAIITNTYPPGDISGVGALAQELALALDADGHRVWVLTRACAPDDRLARPVGGSKLGFPLNAARALRALERRERIDLVHVHESDGVVAVLRARARRLRRREPGPRLVATLQVSYRRERLHVRPVRDRGRAIAWPTRSERVFAWGRAPILSVAGRITARLADRVVAPSEATARELGEDYGARDVAVIPNGVTLPEGQGRRGLGAEDGGRRVEGARAEAGGERGPLILYAGRLRTRKAVAVLVEAMPQVRAALPGVELALLGDGEQRPALEGRVAELGLHEAIRFEGAVPRARTLDWYRKADLFCLPSTYEGFPVAILEAMAHGLPVVATRVAGIPEAVEDGVTGLIVEPEDATALAEALIRVAADRELGARMGARGRARLESLFSRERVAREYLRIFAATLEGARG